jgi:hypothetical protein
MRNCSVVLEIKNEAVVFLRVRAIEPRQSLNGFDPRERLVHIHRVQQWFIVAGLKLVGANEEAIRFVLYLCSNFAAWESVERELTCLGAVVFVFS